METYSKTNCDDIILSIIIPVYNVSQYIEETLNSILSSPIGNIEIIAIDDGSTDNSHEILQKWFTQHSFQGKIIKNKNNGPGKSRNQGVTYSRGKYILFFDSDDILLPAACKKAIDCLEAFNLDLVILRGLSFDQNTLHTFSFPDDHLFDEIIGDKKFKSLSIATEPRLAKLEVSPVRRIVRKDFWTKNNLSFLEGVYFEDIVPHVRTILANPKLGILNYHIFKYRTGRNNQITSIFGEKRKDIICSFEESIEHMLKSNISEDIGANLSSIFIKMGIWCASFTEYDKKHIFFDQFLSAISKLPEEWIELYEKKYASDQERIICHAIKHSNIESLINISEGNFSIPLEKNYSDNIKSDSLPDSKRAEYHKTPFAFCKKIIKNTILFFRSHILRIYQLIRHGE